MKEPTRTFKYTRRQSWEIQEALKVSIQLFQMAPQFLPKLDDSFGTMGERIGRLNGMINDIEEKWKGT
jgi:hypothetical protein